MDIDVHCRVLVGGRLRSRKGLNLPGTDLGIRAFTERDRECLKFALEQGVDAVSFQEETCQALQFSYGVFPVHEPEHPEDWNRFAADLLRSHGMKGDLVVLTEGPSPNHPDANLRMELIDLRI